jgi:hypothetical protein
MSTVMRFEGTLPSQLHVVAALERVALFGEKGALKAKEQITEAGLSMITRRGWGGVAT